METGVSTACFFGREQIEDGFDRLRSMGIGVTEVFLNTFSEYERGFVSRLCDLKGDIRVHSVHAHGTCFEPELFSSHDRIRRDAESIFMDVCAAASALGAKFYTFHGPFLKVNRPVAVDFVRFSDRMNELCEIAAEYGTEVAYENVCWAYGSSVEFFEKLLPLCPRLKTTLDVKQALYSGVEPLRFAEAMAGRIATVHICDMDENNAPCLAGRGRYDFREFFKRLKTLAPTAPALLEVYKGSYSDYDELAENHAYLARLVREANG